MKIISLSTALLLSTCPLYAQAANAPKPSVKASRNAPRAATLRALQADLKSSLSRVAETKVALPNLQTYAGNPVRPATRPALLAASRLTNANDATTFPKDFNSSISNFSRGAKTAKIGVLGARKTGKTNMVRARSSAAIRSSLSVSNLRKLALIKTP